MDYRSLVERARAQIEEISPNALYEKLGPGLLIIDVREPGEYDQGALPGAVLIPRGTLESSIASHAPEPGTPIVLYCEVGARSALATLTLHSMGYRNVASLAGGITRWKRDGLPWDIPQGLSGDQRSRYARHLRLPEVGEAGQQKLLDARVLLVGAGGLGSPAALYLAAAGIGTIGVIDFDVVDPSNLQRQVLHNLDRVGEAKVESARRTMTSLNPDVKVEPYRSRLDASNVLDIMSSYDLVVDGADNFPTRYLVNDASLHTRVPVVHGSIYRFEGQVTVFAPLEGPCYRCLFPEPPPAHLAPSCEEGGVLGVLPGVIGSLQATEAIKIILGSGSSLVGRLLIYDALESAFSELRVPREPVCPSCGDPDRPPVIVDYDESCRPVS